MTKKLLWVESEVVFFLLFYKRLLWFKECSQGWQIGPAGIRRKPIVEKTRKPVTFDSTHDPKILIYEFTKKEFGFEGNILRCSNFEK